MEEGFLTLAVSQNRGTQAKFEAITRTQIPLRNKQNFSLVEMTFRVATQEKN